MKKQTQKYCRLCLNIISDMPELCLSTRVGHPGKQRRTEGQQPVNAKRLYRKMSEHNLLLLHHKPERPKREHKGKIAVQKAICAGKSDGFEFGCDNGEKLRVTFALDCCECAMNIKAGSYEPKSSIDRAGCEHLSKTGFDTAGRHGNG
jgi:hypothetical protein